MAETKEEIVEEMQTEEFGTIEQEVTNVQLIEHIDAGEVVELDGIAADAVPADMKIYKSFKCHLCKIYFNRLHTLKTHITSQHPQLDWSELYRTTTFKCGEPNCKFIGKTRTDLLAHLHQEHDFVLHKVEGEFFSHDDFTLFFERLQKAHKVRFVKKRGRALESMTQYFVCSRDGYTKSSKAFKLNEAVRKRNSTSHKIGTFCTAHVTVRNFAEGRITIEGYTTHYNHRVEGKHLSLLDSERKFIKYHAQRGMAIRDIIDLIHRTIGASVCEDDPLRFLNSRTVRNVIHSVTTEVPSSATHLFAQVNAPETVEGRISSKSRREVTLVDVVRGHTQSLGESYEIFIDAQGQQFGKEEWGIKSSQSSIRYKVERVADKCSNEIYGYTNICQLTCVHCKCCAHIYSCNCQSGKLGKMCQHIHAICQYLRRLEREQKEQEGEEVEQICETEQVVEEIPEGEVNHEMIDHVVQEEQIEIITSFDQGQQLHKGHPLVTSLVFHDYERKSPEDITRSTIDPEFIRLIEDIKGYVGQIEHSIDGVDVLSATMHFETLKTLISRAEGPKMVTIEEAHEEN